MDIELVKKEIENIPLTAFGKSVPHLRKLGKLIAKGDYKQFLETNSNDTFELRMVHAFVLGYAKDDIRTLLNYFEQFMPYVDDWAVNDTLCQSFKVTKNYQEEVWEFLMRFRTTTDEFTSRIVSVMLLTHYLNDEYIDRVIEVIDGLNTDEYYSQMGVAWAIATLISKYPQKGLDYLHENNLDDKTHRKTLQKIRESYRVSDEIKSKIKLLRQAH